MKLKKMIFFIQKILMVFNIMKEQIMWQYRDGQLH